MKRKTPLKRSRKALEARKGIGRAPAKGKPSAKARHRKNAKWRNAFHSVDRVRFVASLPCVICGEGPCENHHEPTRGVGGKYTDISPLCGRCHFRRHAVGVITFWRAGGQIYEEANARTQALWEQHQGS